MATVGSSENKALRQGVRANGWVLLSQVRLGYEIWRQLNGFPLTVAENQAAAEMKETRAPTLRSE